MKKCPRCGKELPVMTEDGKHNFCPASTPDGGIIDVCIDCKVSKSETRQQTHRFGGG